MPWVGPGTSPVRSAWGQQLQPGRRWEKAPPWVLIRWRHRKGTLERPWHRGRPERLWPQESGERKWVRRPGPADQWERGPSPPPQPANDNNDQGNDERGSEWKSGETTGTKHKAPCSLEWLVAEAIQLCWAAGGTRASQAIPSRQQVAGILRWIASASRMIQQRGTGCKRPSVMKSKRRGPTRHRLTAELAQESGPARRRNQTGKEEKKCPNHLIPCWPGGHSCIPR